MIKYIFFDFDGTISDAKRLTYDKFLETLQTYNFKFSKQKLKDLMGVKTRKILKGLGIDGRNYQKVKRKFYKNVMEEENIKSLKLCSDVKPLYKIKKQGVKLIVLSNSHRPFVTKSIKVLKIGDLFDKVYGSRPFRDKDQILRKLFRKYNVKPKEVLYVGDRFSDIDYAHKAHCYAVGIYNKCSWSTKTEILKEKPDFMIKNFEDLKKLVEKLNSN
jgi:phosphoglycolate phosphatase-like HAD superfamily hydrolase